ncbi:MAG: NifB/NifX family molybdenum-iron cluster-binding protein [Anaerolineales bacterium]|nr:NifB/NifX family molybdenum-iron cluster-binding protein [Anaerolineales bacterium]
MKIIISTVTPNIESEVDPRFGRGAYLLVVDPNTLEWQAHPNPGVNASGGAGIKAAQFVVEQKVDAVISGDFGPHAFDALNAANVPMYVFGATRTVRDAIARFNVGQLERVGAATRADCHSESKA